VSDPRASRPYMPGNGIVGPDEGRGLLPWSWAEERLIASHNYWVATVWPDGRPHVMPVEGSWHDESLWFSSSVKSRKGRNLRADPRTVVTTDNPIEPVVIEGVAEVVREPRAIAELVWRLNDKYSSEFTVAFLDPDVNATFRVRPNWVFGLNDKEFTESPTRWEFPDRRSVADAITAMRGAGCLQRHRRTGLPGGPASPTRP
jgi:PPOX class probable F420-dependent enzyme